MVQHLEVQVVSLDLQELVGQMIDLVKEELLTLSLGGVVVQVS